MKKLCYLICIALLVSSCGTQKKVAPQEGRIAIQSGVSERIAKTKTSVQISTPVSNTSWMQTSANASNLMPHGKIQANAEEIWSRNVGKGISKSYLVLPEPVIVNHTIYALDGAFQLSAIEEATGNRLWQKELPVQEDMSMASIGLASDGSRLYIVGGDGIVYATDLKGETLWSHNTNAILRSAPTIADGRIYILSGNNELFVLNTHDGSEAWHFQNISTDTNLFGMGQPAVSKGVAIIPFSSGEIIAFNAKSGMMLWSDTLLSRRTFNQINDLSHVVASPVISGDTVYIVGNAKSGAFDLKTGTVRFIQNIGGQNTPIVNGNALFMITTHNTLVALDKKSGALIWETELTSKEPKNIAWKGPVLANNQLLVVSNKGDILFINALNGTQMQTMKSESLSNKPILGKDKIILYTNDADLIAYQ